MGNQIILAVVATLGLLLSNADTRANSIFDRQNSQVDEIEVGCAWARTLMSLRSSFPAEKAL